MFAPPARPCSPGDFPESPPARGRWATVLAGGLIAVGALLSYHNSLVAPFVFDDKWAILENPTIRHLLDIRTVLTPPAAGGVAGRPLVNLSLAVNYAFGGTQVLGYHAFNLAVHLLAGLTLFGLVRRTLRLYSGQAPVAAGSREQGAGSKGQGATGRETNSELRASPPLHLTPNTLSDADGNATFLALAVALLWTVHPLLTESVTCVVQRNELLMGLFYLLTLYGVVRGAGAARPVRWHVLSVAACLAGMASKEVMVSAPLMVLLYDRTFVAGTFRAAWQRRRALYLGLAGTWVLLAVLMLGSQKRGGTVGFGLGVSPWDYALTQCRAIVLYLKLALWPHPLVLDYGAGLVKHVTAVLPQAGLLLLLVAATIVALRRWPAWGFAGAWFFAILAPSSSVVPLASQTMAEHRMYLPLVAVVAAAVLGAARLLGRCSGVLLLALALGMGWVTTRRNAVYLDELTLWQATVAAYPESARSHTNLGNTLLAAGRLSEAIGQYEAALRLQPYAPEAHINLSNAFARLGRPSAAVEHGEAALRLEPDSADAHVNLGNALLQLGRVDEAIGHYEAALRIQPDAPDVRVNLGAALLRVGRAADAVRQYEAAARLEPARAETQAALANALVKQGDTAAALPHLAEAVRLNPTDAEAHFTLGNLYAESNQFPEAIAAYQEAVRLDPTHFMARNNLGNALMVVGRVDEAIVAYTAALQLQPDNATVRGNLRDAQALRRTARPGS